MRQKATWVFLSILWCASSAGAQQTALPSSFPLSTSANFCVAVQQRIAATNLVGDNTLFTDMPSYRHSKPSVSPLKIFQVVTYAGQMPLVVSCKMKTAAHLRKVYGAGAAGPQLFCPDIARQLQAQAAAELSAEGQADAAQKVAAFIIDDDEPFFTGRDYLKDFHTFSRDADGRIHVSSPGLFQNYDSWYTPLLPEIVQGQSYCHLATVESLKAIATGQLDAGLTITTRDDAPTQSQ